MKTSKILLNVFRDRDTKYSDDRRRIAICLNEFRKTRSMSKASKSLNIGVFLLYKILHCSKRFNNIFYDYKLYSHKDHGIAMTWAKKIMSINYLGGKCKQCGSDNIFHLSFHHKNKEDKRDSIRHFLKYSIV